MQVWLTDVFHPRPDVFHPRPDVFHPRHPRTPPQVEAVDATGAGDAFRAGLIYGLLQGWTLAESAIWGTAAGALKVQRVGAASDLPSREDVASLAATHRRGTGGAGLRGR